LFCLTNSQLGAQNEYYVQYTDNNDRAVAKSKPFNLKGMLPRTDEQLCTISTSRTIDPRDGQIVLTVSWNFVKPRKFLTDSNKLVVVQQADVSGQYKAISSSIYGFASGSPRGSVKLHLLGLVTSGTSYRIHYADTESHPHISLGYSDVIVFQNDEIKEMDATETETAKQKSDKYNLASMMQHSVAATEVKAAGKSNPLLTITPEENVYQKLIDARKAHKDQIIASIPTNESVATNTTSSTRIDDSTVMIDEADLLSRVVGALDNAQGFIYAGAGVSMSAPSSSPSWWALMNEVIVATFKAAPPQHADLAAMIAKGDNSRQVNESPCHMLA
jgi:hypothetical protein